MLYRPLYSVVRTVTQRRAAAQAKAGPLRGQMGASCRTPQPVVRGDGRCAPSQGRTSSLPPHLPPPWNHTPRAALHTSVGSHLQTLHPGPHLPPALVHSPLTWWLWFQGLRGADWSQGILFSVAAAAGGGGGQVPLQTGTRKGPFSLPSYTREYTHVHADRWTPGGPRRLAALRPQAQEPSTHL